MSTLTDKYRPQTLDEIYGQEANVTILKNSIKSNRLHSSYLFSGARGTGKTSTARILAKIINCEKDNKPCNICDNCISIHKKHSNDIIEIDAASHRKVEDIEQVLEDIRFVPFHSKKKIYILDEFHMLSDHAFNALLKVLEEPPTHIVFILCTTVPEKIPDTVRSRCLQLIFKNPGIENIKKYLMYVCEKENLKYDVEALETLAERAGGSFRDALITLESLPEITTDSVRYYHNILDNKIVIPFIYAILTRNTKSCLQRLNKFVEEGGTIKYLVYESIRFLRLMNAASLGSDLKILRLSTTETQNLAIDLTNRLCKNNNKPPIIEALLMLSDIRYAHFEADLIKTEVAIIEYCARKEKEPVNV